MLGSDKQYSTLISTHIICLLIAILIVILVGVKAAWYFYYSKCSLAVWLCQIL